MYFYKFRVYFDDVEDFVRDIEIRSTDSFESFHNIIYSSTGLTGNELASFFICDTKWNKQKEITLIDMEDETDANVPEYEDSDDFSTKSNIPKTVMKDSVLKDFIEDPHQHIIYEYDFLNPKNFYIELLKTLPADPNVVYPRCTYKVKELPKDIKLNPIPNPEDDYFEDEEGSEFDDGFNEEDHLDLENIEDFGADF